MPGVVGRKVDPLGLAKPLEPGSLCLGEPAGVDFDLFYRVFKRNFSLDVLNNLCIAQRPAGGRAQRSGFGQQGLYLINQALVDHSLYPGVGPAVLIVALIILRRVGYKLTLRDLRDRARLRFPRGWKTWALVALALYVAFAWLGPGQSACDGAGVDPACVVAAVWFLTARRRKWI